MHVSALLKGLVIIRKSLNDQEFAKTPTKLAYQSIGEAKAYKRQLSIYYCCNNKVKLVCHRKKALYFNVLSAFGIIIKVGSVENRAKETIQ